MLCRISLLSILSMLSVTIVILLLLPSSSSSIYAATVDISSLQNYESQTLPSSMSSLEIARFTGRISSNQVFSFASNTVPTNTQVFFDIILEENATLLVRDTIFPSSLRIAVSGATPSTSGRIRLENIHSTCSASSASFSTPDPAKIENVCTSGSQLKASPDSLLGFTPTYFAALVEIKPFLSSVDKSNAGTISISSENSKFEAIDDTLINASTSLVSFAVQRYHENFDDAGSRFSSTSLGATVPKGSPSSSFTTILPFVSTHFSTNNSFTCNSDSRSIFSSIKPVLIACLVIGNNFYQASSSQGATALAFAREFVMEVPLAEIMSETLFYYQPGGFNAQLLVDTISISDSCTFQGSCNRGDLCIALGLSQIIFQRISIRDVVIELENVYAGGGGIILSRSYGDNFTKGITTTDNNVTIDDSLPNFEKQYQGNQQQQLVQQQQQQQHLSNSSSNNNRTFPSSYFIIDNASITISQVSANFYASRDLYLACLSGISISASDVDLILLRRLNGNLTTAHAKTTLIGVSFLVRTENFIISDQINFQSGFYDYTGRNYGVDKNNAAIMVRFMEFVKRVKLVNFETMNMTATYIHQALLGTSHLKYFDYFWIENWKAVSNVIKRSVTNAAGIIFYELGYSKYGVLVRNINFFGRSRQNALFVYFEPRPVTNLQTHGIIVENVRVDVAAGFTTTCVMSNSTFLNVPKFALRNFTFSAKHWNEDDEEESESGSGEAPPPPPPASLTLSGLSSSIVLTPITKGFGDTAIMEDGSVDLENDVTLVVNSIVPSDIRHGETDTFIIVKNIKASLRGGTLSGAASYSMGIRRAGEYGVATGITEQPGPLFVAPSVLFADCDISFDKAAFISTFVLAALVRLEGILLRNTQVYKGVTMFRPMFNTRGELGKIDVSSDSTLARSTNNNNDIIQNVLGAPGCSHFNGDLLFGRSVIISKFMSMYQPETVVSRYCGNIKTQTETKTGTFYIPWRRTRTETNHSLTKSLTKSKSLSGSNSVMPPALDLSTPRAASAISTVATAASVFGASGASVALDGSRAVSVLALLSRCNSYKRRGKSNAGVSDEDRKKEFHDEYLSLEPSFPENPLPFLCFGDERGACIRGAVFSCILVLILVCLIVVFGYGTYMLHTVFPMLSPEKQASATRYQYSQAPFLVGMLFCFLIGSWSTQSVVLLSISGLPDGDAVLAVLSIILYVCAYCFVFITIWRRVNLEGDEKNSSTTGGSKSSSSLIFDRWRCEEMTVAYEKELQQSSSNNNDNINRSRSNNKNSSGRRKQKEKSFLEKVILLLISFAKTPLGKYLGYGDFVWTERDDDEIKRLQKEAQRNMKHKQNNRNFSSSGDHVPSRGLLFSAGGDDDEELLLGSPRQSTYRGSRSSRNSSKNNRNATNDLEEMMLMSDNNNNNDDDQQNSFDLLISGDDAFSRRLRKFQKSGGGKKARSGGGGSDKKMHFTHHHQQALSNSTDSNETDSAKRHHNNNNKNKSSSSKAKQNNNKSSSASTSTSSSPPAATLPSSANGAVGSVLWNFGSLINKHIGPHHRDMPLEHSSEAATSSSSIAARRKRNSDNHNKKSSSSSQSQKQNYEISRLGGVPTRRYFYNEMRLRVAPYYTLVSLSWTLITTIGQAAAIVNPDHCDSVVILMAVVNVVSFLVDCWLRPFLVSFRNHAIIVAGTFLATGTVIAATGDREAMTDPDSQLFIIAQTCMMVFLYLLLTVSVIIGFCGKFILRIGEGRLLVRRDVIQRMDSFFADAEENLMELVLADRLQKQYGNDTGGGFGGGGALAMML